jgi:hypothetical protein
VERKTGLGSLVAFLSVVASSQALWGCSGTQDVDLGDKGGTVASAGTDSEDSQNGSTGGTGAVDSGGKDSNPTGGTTGTSDPSSDPEACNAAKDALATMLAAIQRCESDADCGASVSEGTCGCTRATPVRRDAKTAEYIDLVKKVASCSDLGGGTCDCPPADGFACVENKCEWNYAR